MLLVFWAPSGPAAREIAIREPAARSGRSRSPPVPSGPSGALYTSEAWSLMLLGAWPRSPARPRRPRGGLQSGEACSCEWPPGPAAAHRHRGQALRSLLIGGLPACLLVAPRVFRAPSGPAAREIATREPAARSGRSRSPPVPSGPSGALHTSGAWCADVVRHVCLKPSSPLLAGTCVGVKPASPLRVRNGRFGCVFRLQR